MCAPHMISELNRNPHAVCLNDNSPGMNACIIDDDNFQCDNLINALRNRDFPLCSAVSYLYQFNIFAGLF